MSFVCLLAHIIHMNNTCCLWGFGGDCCCGGGGGGCGDSSYPSDHTDDVS